MTRRGPPSWARFVISSNLRFNTYKCRDGSVIDHQSPYVVGYQAGDRRPHATYRDTYKQPKNEYEGDANHDGGVLVNPVDTPPSPDPSQKPCRIVRGTNKRGNKFLGEHYPDGTNPYQYDNQDGTHYEKHRDGSADLLHRNRGFAKHYAAPVMDEPVGFRQLDIEEARDLSQGYPKASRKNMIDEGHKHHDHRSQPATNRWTSPPSSSSSSPSPSPPPASRNSKTRRSTKTWKQDSVKARRAF
ncbi:hypothetical protein BJ322DRAFT_1206815 [Thelephora terrestris]|uniref:Uncharacterized protein n=1 Tax=Thelephora terrestris TaxID=56493 RepID=A0A9P6LBV0_9AGAM|nr:hypothetical protein BJ322DRAFT_1206815 [Thelephora terrestris]